MIQPLSKYTSYIFTFLLTLGMIFGISTYAATPEQSLGFQGQLFESNTPKTGSVNATFTFYDAATGGNTTGTPIVKTVTVNNGYFSTQFTESDTTGVDFYQQLYLEVSVNGTTLSPRTTVNPTVSSLKSFGTFSYASAPTVGPVGSLYFNSTSGELYVSNGTSWQLAGLASSTTQWVANGTSLNYMAGNVGVGTSTPSALLTLVDRTGGSGYDPVLFIDSDRALGQQSVISMLNRNSTDSNGNYIFMTNEVASGVGVLTGPTLILNNARPTGEAPVAGETFGQFTVRSNSQSGVRDINRAGIRFWTPDATTTEFQIGMRSMTAVNGSTFATVQMVVRNELGTTLVGIGTTTPTATLSVKGRGVATGTVAMFTDSTNTPKFTFLDNGTFGIGTTTPEYSLDIVNGVAAVRTFQNTNASGGFIRLMHARGTATAPVVVNSADRLSAVVSQGYDGTSFLTSATIETYVDGAVATGSIPTSMRFFTTQVGAGGRSERMRITNAGFMGIGVTDPDSKLTIIASSTTFANQFTLRSARVGLVSGDILGAIDFSSNDTNLGTLGSTTASIVAVANTTHTASAQGTDLAFRVTNSVTTYEALRILGGGNIGIGTSTPTRKLVLEGAGADLQISNTQVNGRTWRLGDGSGVGVSGGTFSITDDTGGSVSRFTINSSGNVGIATTTPNAKLHIGGATNNDPTFYINSVGNAEAFSVTSDTSALSGYNGTLVRGGPNNNFIFQTLSNGSDEGFRFINDSNTHLVSILRNGNVGIGSSTPVEKLSVTGNFALTGDMVTNGNLSFDYSSASDGISGYSALGNQIMSITRQNNPINASLAINSYGAIGFVTNNTSGSASTNYSMVIGTNGYVGIGTTTPVSRLIIEGAIANTNSGQGIVISSNNGSTVGPRLAIFPNGNSSAAIQTLQNGALNFISSAGITNASLADSTGNLNILGTIVSNGSGNSSFVGNLGIGTTTPIGPLTVKGSASSYYHDFQAGHFNLTNGSDRRFGFTSNGNGLYGLSDSTGTLTGGSLTLGITGNNHYIGTDSIRMSFFVSSTSTAALTLRSNGNVGVGTTSPVSKLSVAGDINSTDLLGGATTLSTDANGNIIRTPSDSKLKTNVETLTSALDKVNAMRGVSYTWLDTNRFGTSTEIGFIAQELETIVPEVVKSGGEYKSVNYQNLTALLTEAIKELSAKFDGFSKKVKTEELCIGETCIKEQELKDFIRFRNSQMNTSSSPAPTPSSNSDEVNPEPESTTETPPEPPTPEPTPEPAPAQETPLTE